MTKADIIESVYEKVGFSKKEAAEVKSLLDAAEQRTAEARARAARELDQLGTPAGPDGGSRRDARGARKEGPGGAQEPARPKGK